MSGDFDEDGFGYERPLGGSIELGERAAQIARRDMREEIGQDIEHLRLLDVMESMFTVPRG